MKSDSPTATMASVAFVVMDALHTAISLTVAGGILGSTLRMVLQKSKSPHSLILNALLYAFFGAATAAGVASLLTGNFGYLLYGVAFAAPWLGAIGLATGLVAWRLRRSKTSPPTH